MVSALADCQAEVHGGASCFGAAVDGLSCKAHQIALLGFILHTMSFVFFLVLKCYVYYIITCQHHKIAQQKNMLSILHMGLSENRVRPIG